MTRSVKYWTRSFLYSRSCSIKTKEGPRRWQLITGQRLRKHHCQRRRTGHTRQRPGRTTSMTCLCARVPKTSHRIRTISSTSTTCSFSLLQLPIKTSKILEIVVLTKGSHTNLRTKQPITSTHRRRVSLTCTQRCPSLVLNGLSINIVTLSP